MADLQADNSKRRGRALVLGVVGAFAGAIVGALVFKLALRSGLYMIAFPGAAVGLGCGLLSRIYSPLLGVISGALALILGIYLEFSISAHEFSYFITHLHQAGTMTLAMLGLGVIFAYWFGMGRSELR